MAAVVQLANVNLFAEEPFGLKRVSLEIQPGRNYLLEFATADQLNALLGILEGRFRPDTGQVYKAREYLCQSDRLLLGDKVYRRHAGGYLALEAQPFTRFEGRRQGKRSLMESIKAWHLRHFPIYKLHKEDKLRFVLCALAFQESGLMLISRLFQRELGPEMSSLIQRILQGSGASVVLAVDDENPSAEAHRWAQQAQATSIDLRGSGKSG